MMIRPTVLSLALCLLAACHQTADSGATPAKPVASIASSGARPSAATSAKPSGEATPEVTARSEEALIQVVARALGSRNLKALQAGTTVEFAADLQRMHDLDPAAFWIRASAFVQNVKTGFEVLHRQEDTRDQWNIVVRFGNSREERLTFTREGGKLRFVDL